MACSRIKFIHNHLGTSAKREKKLRIPVAGKLSTLRA